MLAACVSPQAGFDGTYATPIGTAPVISNETPYSAALRCMADYSQSGLAPRIAVGQIVDFTGKEEFEGGKKLTQGAALMAISALSKAGARLVERFDTSVAELELKYANNRLIGDTGQAGDFRKILAGSMPGSDYYLVGGITELNYNIRSVGGEAFGGEPAADAIKGRISGSLYVMNVGLDLRLIKTSTLEVVDVISYQKQIIGREISAGVFDILNGTIVDLNLGERALEPIQLAVRAVIERAVLEMTASLYGIDPEACRSSLGPAGDPLADQGGFQAPRKRPVTTAAATTTTTTTTTNTGVSSNDELRQEPYRGYRVDDPAVAGLRSSLD